MGGERREIREMAESMKDHYLEWNKPIKPRGIMDELKTNIAQMLFNQVTHNWKINK